MLLTDSLLSVQGGKTVHPSVHSQTQLHSLIKEPMKYEHNRKYQLQKFPFTQLVFHHLTCTFIFYLQLKVDDVKSRIISLLLYFRFTFHPLFPCLDSSRFASFRFRSFRRSICSNNIPKCVVNRLLLCHLWLYMCLQRKLLLRMK